MGKNPLFDWCPDHLQQVLAAIGISMHSKRLRPDTLQSVPKGLGAILPGHLVSIAHISGKSLDRRKGHYLLEIEGPVFAGRWRFSSGDLEKLANAAVCKVAERR